MSIEGIANVYLRRSVLLVAFIPLVLVATFCAVMEAVLDVARDAGGAFAGAWKGNP